MAIARKNVVLENESAVYLTSVRCVRRAFLCGLDELTGNNYEHRRQWIEDRLIYLLDLFFVNLYAHSVMSNHYHVVFATDFERANETDDREIVRRWLLLTSKEKDKQGNPVPPTELSIEAALGNKEAIKEYRSRLCSVSWFMRYINEWLARRSNKEDDCTGRFWQGRFDCQRLEDEGAILACMAYVDLNPVRAKMAESPENSKFTSAFRRILARQAEENEKAKKEISEKFTNTDKQKEFLEENNKNIRSADFLTLIEKIFENKDIVLDDYLSLLDFTGREIHEGKRGQIPAELAPILNRLDLDTENWIETVQKYGSLFYYFAGKLNKLKESAERLKKHWCCGKPGSEFVYKHS